MTEERASALQIADAETEEFTFSARNEVEWLNEHMAEIFSKNQVYVNTLLSVGCPNNEPQQRCRDIQDAGKATWEDAADCEEAQPFRGACCK